VAAPATAPHKNGAHAATLERGALPRGSVLGVPDSIREREPVVLAHIVQRDRVRASIMAVPDKRTDRQSTYTPTLVYPTA
jgi:hypothetical protein